MQNDMVIVTSVICRTPYHGWSCDFFIPSLSHHIWHPCLGEILNDRIFKKKPTHEVGETILAVPRGFFGGHVFATFRDKPTPRWPKGGPQKTASKSHPAPPKDRNSPLSHLKYLSEIIPQSFPHTFIYSFPTLTLKLTAFWPQLVHFYPKNGPFLALFTLPHC